ncbi:acetolactate synthase small subunit [Alicyclobacillus acidocaldarius]|uniref:Acetolactate synthase small subunit n=1 Tax=Alicyclobacillus acidocaldarius subsp. acidocaldarius (strain ATCC 27009 / DSM 446 / BCRC 14685 / JCM 5260 / KCTC 1825 / NBRC 15652 / NCIMB 11725 / NRRL B-14509 / 104-IA) TaxID=521098 RepID=C8WR68_ALIAD|nr:acetolactate synthase small subunit [Alicyclobacillus acidocaldarius]ACV59237.1 acetolactate synthase, small subunit [Alicyclobacillus acidocaldarius subsp. acidocaldarius DSM 446]
MTPVLSVLVHNKPGVLNRITALFMRKGFNIQSLTVCITENPEISRMTIVMSDMDEAALEQVIKQLHKQIDVLKVTDLTDQAMVARELALIRVSSPIAERAVIHSLIEPFRANIVDVGRETVTVQVTGDAEKIDALIALLRPYGIRELARTGLTALPREAASSADPKRAGEAQVLHI